MINSIKMRILQGDPIVHDVRKNPMSPVYRGFPIISDAKCADNCTACFDICPVKAISLDPVSIDLGKCVYCPECEKICPAEKIHFSQNYIMSATERGSLVIKNGMTEIKPETASEKIRKYFGKSLKLRQVSAGGCSGCELELNAAGNINFDMGRFGIEFTASPRHSDGIVITGPITKNMAKATEICLEAVPNPKIIILNGACAISGGIFQNSTEIDRSFLEKHKIDLYVPGCPPHPLTFVTALLNWLDRK
ncbi:MAG TPA: NADH:ubiquinone oxidoreductase [bacterium]|jgi:Ni,Fe-hydrogenase III small subunit/NAD-dependent dihydropyrimidine dehydrogenase PreA subunit|nr:NADH:ubiquinone oxidoreductase [bacterium]HNW15809.1 NADH:ubiquinone oxidoreductase [bacterium]HPG34774.1 NADH:ubiquinone oxidoreductase [bacterium]HPM46478.1 NADH:ubiquinone oxidoreductase [bacterium]HRQ68862.1 NADH:ubiquinone oxidoreductase [bacterium]